MKKHTISKIEKSNHIIRLTDEQKKDPKLVFLELFDSYDLNYIRASLWEWLLCAMANNTHYFQEGKQRSNLIHLYQHIEVLVEASYLVFTEKDWDTRAPNARRAKKTAKKKSYQPEK